MLSVFSFQGHSNLPLCLVTPLLFVKYFTPMVQAEDDPTGVKMSRVQCPPSDAACQHLSQYCGIVLLTSILCALELIPVSKLLLQSYQMSEYQAQLVWMCTSSSTSTVLRTKNPTMSYLSLAISIYYEIDLMEVNPLNNHNHSDQFFFLLFTKG